MWQMPVEEQAARCKNDLETTLRSLHKWTADAASASDLLLNRMNAVLSAAVDSNFGDGCTTQLKALYRSISRLQLGMESIHGDLPLLFFARSFAAVLDEAVRQRSKATPTVPRTPPHTEEMMTKWRGEAAITVSPPPPYTFKAAESWSGETPNEDQLVQTDESSDREVMKYLAEVVATTAKPTAAAAAAATKKEAGGRAVEKYHVTVAAHPATTSAVVNKPTAAAAAKREQEEGGKESAYRAKLRRMYPHKILDFSAEAIEGRVSIYHLARTVRTADVRQMLQPFGRIVDMYVGEPAHNDTYALVKLESNAAANQAVASLNGSLLAGKKIKVQRLEYLGRYRDAPKQTWPMICDRQSAQLPTMQQQQPSLRPSVSNPSSNQAAEEIGDQRSARDQRSATESHGGVDVVQEVARIIAATAAARLANDDTIFELGDDRSDGSFFSID